MRLRKLSGGLTALALCFLLTGFFGGGEKPQDCITAIIKALENNDSKAFGERVPLEFFISMTSLANDEFQSSIKTAVNIVNNTAEAQNFTAALASAITPSVQRMARSMQENILQQVDSGKTALQKGSMWTPDVLGAIVVSEEGSGDEKNTATAVVTGPDNVKLTLGLVKIGDKWVMLSVGGNKKSALDMARTFKVRVEQRTAELAERRKGNELWLKEFGPIYEKAAKLDDEKLIQAMNENIPSELYEVSRKPKILNISNITLEAPELWNSVTHNLLEGMRSQKIAPITTVLDESDYTEYNNQLTEIVFRTGDVLITKTLYCSYTETSGNKREGYNKWLSGELNEAGSNTGYMCFVKKDKRWTLVCFVGSSPEDSLFGYLARFRNSFPDPVEYLAEFGKRYATLEANARNILKNEQVWKDSLQKTMKTVGEAIAVKNGKGLATLVDVPRLLRNRDSVETTAKWRLEKAEKNQDVTAFMQEIDTGTLTPENPLNGLNLAAATITSVTDTQGVAVAGSQHLLFERADASAPWKLTRVAKNEKTLTLPADWEKQVETKLVELRKEKELEAKKQAERELLQKSITSLHEAVAAKNGKALGNLMDIPAVLRNRDSVEASAAWRLEKAEKNQDVTAFMQEIDTGTLTPENPLNGLDFATATVKSITETQGVATIGSQYLLFERAKEANPWKLVRVAGTENALFFPEHEDWETKVEENIVTLRANKESAAKLLAALSTLLSEKKGEKFVQNIDMATLTYWDPNAKSSALDLMDVRLVEATIFPNMLLTQRQDMIDSVNATGTCVLNGIKVSADLLKQATLTIYGDGGLGVRIAERVLWFVPVSEDAIRLVSTAAISGESTKNTFVKQGENSYESIQKSIARGGVQYLKPVAMMSCIDAILDTVQISAQKYTVLQGGETKYWSAFNDKLLVLEMDLEINTTGTQPCTTEGMRVVFTSEAGDTTYQEDWDIESIRIEPYRSTRKVVAVTLSESAMYWMQQVRDRKARISFRPLSIWLENKTYSESRQKDLLKDLRLNADGTWQLGTFPPVKLRLDTLKTRSEEADAALKALRDEQKAKETGRLNEIKQRFIDKVIVEYTPSSRTLTLRNTLGDGVAIKKLLAQTLENGVVKDSKTIPLETDVRANHTETIENINIPMSAGSSLKVRVADMKVGYDWGEKKIALHSGVVPPLLYQTDPVLFTLTAEQLAEAPKTEALKTEAPKAEAPKTEAPKTEAPKTETPAEAPKTEAPKAETPKAEAPAEAPKVETPAAPATVTAAPTPPEGKNSGKAVLGSTAMDVVGTAFAPDGNLDSVIRVSVKNPSPLVAVRIDNIGGTMVSWKTSGVKTSAKGVIAVVQDGKPLNADNAAFNLDVTKPVVLDLLVQDTGAIAEGKTRLRAVFHHQDGKRSYAILEAAKK